MKRLSRVAFTGTVLVTALLCAGLVQARDLAEVYQRVRASVVVIETTQKEVDPTTEIGLVAVGGLGSGVLISDDGKVMTAAHVVQTADAIEVTFLSGETIPARVLASEPHADLALLQLERRPSVAHVASIGDSDEVQVGNEVFVVGAPLGISHSLTVGHISARRIEETVFGGFLPTEMFQTDTAVNQGNSGGPMFNLDGEVIGIVSYIISQGGGFEGLGFVITSNMARRLLLDQRSMWSGMQGYLLTGELAKIFNLPQERGVLVQNVALRSPAAHLGLRGGTIRASFGGAEIIVGGDVILEAMGISLVDESASETVRERFRSLESGEEMLLKVLRAGEVVELKNYFFPEILVPQAPE